MEDVGPRAPARTTGRQSAVDSTGPTGDGPRIRRERTPKSPVFVGPLPRPSGPSRAPRDGPGRCGETGRSCETLPFRREGEY